MHGIQVQLKILLVLVTLSRCNDVELNFYIDEECSIGHIVGNLRQTKQTNMEKITQTIFQTNKDIDSLFSLDGKSGDLKTNSRIDRDILCPETDKCLVKLTILQVSESHPETWITVNIYIEDINDNRATFQISDQNKMKDGFYEIHVRENNIPFTEYPLPRAVDVDSQKFGVITYQLEDFEGNLESERRGFDLQIRNNFEPILIARDSFDYEIKKEFKLTLIAMEEKNSPGKITSTMTSAKLNIKLKIIDVNDNAPVFLLPEIGYDNTHELSLEENTPFNSVILTCKAIDADADRNGLVKYRFLDEHNNESLRINQDTGEITLTRDIKAHVNSDLQYLVVAHDMGEDVQMNATFLLKVFITDQNDHAPVITVKPTGRLPTDYQTNQVFVREKSIQNNEALNLALIFVEDLDVGMNGQVNCSLASQNVYLSEKGISIKLELTKTGIFSSKTLYKLKILHFFTNHWDSRTEKTIQLTCQDNGKPSKLTSAVNLNLRIIREEDFELKFEREEYSKDIVESPQNIEDIFKISIMDSDALIRYSFEEENNNSCQSLALDSVTGVISAPNGLDREERDTIICKVKAIESGHTTTSKETFANILIRVIDVNDNRPKLSNNLITNGLNITEYNRETNVGDNQKYIGKVLCEDDDAGVNGQISYFLLSVIPNENVDAMAIYPRIGANTKIDASDFIIEKDSGKLYILGKSYQKIDREITNSLEVTIMCQDSNMTSALSTKGSFRVSVIDVNDCHPIWLEYFGNKIPAAFDENLGVYLPTEIKLQSDSDIYQTINLKAIDPDHDSNGKVIFYPSIRAPIIEKITMLSKDSFSITREGKMRINKLHLKNDISYGFLVTANDNDHISPKSSDALITIRMVSSRNMVISDDPTLTQENLVNSQGQIIFKPYLQPFFLSKQVGVVFGVSLIFVFVCVLLSMLFIVFYVKKKRGKGFSTSRKSNEKDHHQLNVNNSDHHFYEQNRTLNDFFSANKSILGSSPIASTDITYHQDDKHSNSLNNQSVVDANNSNEFFDLNYNNSTEQQIPNATHVNGNYEVQGGKLANLPSKQHNYNNQSPIVYDQHRYGSFTPSPMVSAEYHYSQRKNDDLCNSYNVFYSPKLPPKSSFPFHQIHQTQQQQHLSQNPMSILSHQQSIINNNNNIASSSLDQNCSVLYPTKTRQQFLSNSQNNFFNVDLFQDRKINNFGPSHNSGLMKSNPQLLNDNETSNQNLYQQQNSFPSQHHQPGIYSTHNSSNLISSESPYVHHVQSVGGSKIIERNGKLDAALLPNQSHKV